MPFLSLNFLFFLPVFFLLYWYGCGGSVKAQNILLLAGSWLFYAWWDWSFLLLLAGSSALNYWLGTRLAQAKSARAGNRLVGAGLVQGLGCLLYFKYFNGLLPLGISFYTFKTLSYLLDIRSGKIRPEKDWVVFFSYVAFFPCVTAGPIDRPGSLIPQLNVRREWQTPWGTDGLRQIVWGLFKKVVIADNCARITTPLFDHYGTQPASALLFGAVLYTFQLYADFSGYSDMAIGIGSLLGFRISRNFHYPFFADNIADYWRRWHITLTSWLTDYVYLPLSVFLRDYGKPGMILAVLVTFTAIGIWHGPNWTFVLFGFLHGCYFIPLIVRRRKRPGGWARLAGILRTFVLVAMTNVVFRSRSVGAALGYYRRIFSHSLFSRSPVQDKLGLAVTLGSIFIMLTAEWWQRAKEHPLQIDFIPHPFWRALIYYFLIALILGFGPANFSEFIYIRF